MKVLFLLKYREVQNPDGGVCRKQGLSSGLLNSARMVHEMLQRYGVHGEPCESKIVQVIDNNCIDREVSEFQPDVCIIEAFWVVPEKFEVLRRLHPKVKWLVRNHSNVPFLAQEGQILNWINEYVRQPNVYVASNTAASLEDIKVAATVRDEPHHHRALTDRVVYFPNHYTTDLVPTTKEPRFSRDLHVGCFGAIRPLKNHLEQAIGAIKYARRHGLKLYFHINASRTESGGSPILHNLRALFKGGLHEELVEHDWMPHTDFVKLVGSMDVSIQVSFSETFNIVTADAIMQGVPVVGSSDIFWLSKTYQADPTDSDSIADTIEVALRHAKFGQNSQNVDALEWYNKQSRKAISDTLLYVHQRSN